MIDILIIDDEREAHELLTVLLRDYNGAAIVGHATHVDEGVKLTLEHQPDLVLLDIQMPGKDGFAFIRELRERELFPGVIFVTAHENYAIEAIKNAAFDYLLKPIKKEELYATLKRYESDRARNNRKNLLQLAEMIHSGKPEKIRLNTRTGFIFVSQSEILFIEADGNYSKIYMVNDRMEVSTISLGMMENRLDSASFLRISRSFILNMNFLSRVDRKESTCILESNGTLHKIKIPSQKIKLLEAYF